MSTEINAILVFLLVMVRFSGLIVTAPIFGSANVPALDKIGLAGLLAFLMTPTVLLMDYPLPTEALPFALAAAGELLIGMLLGLVMTLAFSAIQVGGVLMDMQSGFGLINVFNPALETQFPVFGFFFFIIAVLYFLVIDGHHMMIRALTSTFARVPLGGLAPEADIMWIVTAWGAAMFFDGLLIAAPVVAAMMLAYVTMGIMSRLVPQIHLFVVGFPVTIALALLITALSIEFYIVFLDGMFEDMFQRVDVTIEGLA